MKKKSRSKKKSEDLPQPLLRALSRLPDDAILAFDFDGTLAPIRKDPEKAALPLALAGQLAKLGRNHPIALISGRAIDDLASKAPNLPFHLVGSHGFEVRTPEGKEVVKGKATWRKQSRAWKRTFEKDIRSEPALRGVGIEDKAFSLTLHFREARDSGRAIETARRIARAMTPSPRLVDGHLVLNLVPSDSSDKGKALKELMKRLKRKSALFIGDDVTDEHVFEKHLPGVLGVRILPGKGKTSAKYRVSSRGSVLTILRILTQRNRA